jgi:hypothetical protein
VQKHHRLATAGLGDMHLDPRCCNPAVFNPRQIGKWDTHDPNGMGFGTYAAADSSQAP